MSEAKKGKKKTRTLIRDLGAGGARTLGKIDLKKIRGGKGCQYGDLKCSTLVFAAKKKLTVVLPVPTPQ